MAEVNTKEMVSVTKEEMMDVNMEDMADLDIPMMSQVNIDDLMADVAEVQTVLQCNNIGHTVDVNEIYEKLEELTYINREDRIEYVATQLIYKSGIIDEPNVAPEERVFRFSVQSNEDNLVENTSWSRGTVPEVSGSCDTRNQNDVPYSNVIDSAYSGSVTMHPHELCQNFINVPELVTVSQTVVGNQNQPDAGATVLDIDDGYCQESDMDAEAVVREAELIHSIFPQHDFEQIYACLRANKDSDTRVDDVTETFLQINAESGVAQLPYSEVAVTSGMNAKPVDIVHASPVSLCAPSVFPSSAPSNNDNVYHGRATSFDEKPCSNKYSVTSNAVFPQKTSTDADLRHTNVSNSEVTDKEGCQESTESRQIHIFNVGSYIENSHEIITEKLEVEAQCNEDELCEKTIQVTESSVEHKICEEGVEQRRCEESVDDMQLLVKQKVSAEVTPLYFGQKLSEESIDGTPLIVEQTVLEERIEATPLSVIQKVSEESVEVTLSRKDITHLAVSKSEDNMIDLTMCDAEESDTPSYASCRDLDMNVNILKEETDRCNSEHTHMHRDGPCFNADCEVKESHPSCDVYEIMQSDVELNDSDEDIGGTVPDFQMVFQESDTSKTETLETSVSDVHVECDVTAIAETGEQCSMSFESSCSGDLINFMDSLDGENEDDSTVAKLRELFPDARIDYLIKVSHEFGSLTDMANKVLESSENEENVVGDTLSEAGPSVSASLQKPPSQGCRKKEITYKEFESSLPHVDPVLLMEIWDGIGTDYNAVKEFIAQQTQENSNDSQYHMLLSLFPHADPAFLREKCNVIGSNEDSLKDFIEEQLQNKTDAQYHTLRAIFPQTDSAYLHEKCIEIGDDEIAMRAFVAEQLKENEGDDRYHTLLAMFPEKDPAFLREAVERIGDDEDAMKLFVTQQLEEVDGVKFQTLLAVLPDADPDYLHTTFEKIGNDEEAVKVFLLEALENKDYPTRETFLKRQEMTALRRKYKEEFSIEDFIEMFPDPRKHFYEESNNSSSELIRKHGIAYLETRYRNIALEDIITSFQKNGYNLTLTCRELDKWNGPMQLWRETFSCTVPNTEDIPASFLQEVAFIENEERIKDFIIVKEQRKKEAFALAKANGELLECMCCFDSEVMAEDMASCTDGHLFCKECIKRSAEYAIGTAQSGCTCLTDCSAEFSLKVLRTVLTPTVFSRVVQIKQLEEVQAAGIEDLESCPFCDFATIPPSDSKVFLCYNPKCMRDSCRKCKRLSHIPLHCDEVESKEVKMRTFIENRMTDALVRTCWKCKKKFIKEVGCNKMTCTCGALMCYICRNPVTDYSHFNGNGGTEFQKCPLYSDLEVIHDVAVQEEGIKAKKEVQAQNPDIELKYDPTESSGTPH